MKKIVLILLMAFIFTLSINPLEFDKIENKIAVIYYQKGIDAEKAKEVEKMFNIAYDIAGKDLGYAEKKSNLYLYITLDDLYNDIIETFHYDADFIRKTKVIPGMDKDYNLWISLDADLYYIIHQYSHGIIEQISGTGSQKKFKWFDEGIADYEGYKALSVNNPDSAKEKARSDNELIINKFISNKLFNLDEITDVTKWENLLLSNNKKIIYLQSTSLFTYLIDNYGFEKIREVLELIGKKKSFPDAFMQVYKFSVKDFEKAYLNNLKNASAELIEKKKNLRYDFTGDKDVWSKLIPLADDGPDKFDVPEADIRKIFAEIYQDKLFILFTTRSINNNENNSVDYCMQIDANGDNIPEYQIGFNQNWAWLWNLKSDGYEAYKDPNNVAGNIEHEKYFGKTIKFMMPLNLIDNGKNISINFYTFVNKKQYNVKKKWIKVPVTE